MILYYICVYWVSHTSSCSKASTRSRTSAFLMEKNKHSLKTWLLSEIFDQYNWVNTIYLHFKIISAPIILAISSKRLNWYAEVSSFLLKVLLPQALGFSPGFHRQTEKHQTKNSACRYCEGLMDAEWRKTQNAGHPALPAEETGTCCYKAHQWKDLLISNVSLKSTWNVTETLMKKTDGNFSRILLEILWKIQTNSLLQNTV